MRGRPSGRAGGVTKPTCYTTPRRIGPSQAIADDPIRPASDRGRTSRAHALIWIVKIVVSGGLLYVLLVARGPRAALARSPGRRRSRGCSSRWLLYLVMILISAWRWGLLLRRAARRRSPFGTLVHSYLVATFFNNFLPSNIGGDVVRIRDTARARRLQDARDDGRAASTAASACWGWSSSRRVGATSRLAGANTSARSARACSGRLLAGALVVAIPAMLFPHGVAALLRPLQRDSSGVGRGPHRAADDGPREVPRRQGRAPARVHRRRSSCRRILVGFYAAIAQALHVHGRRSRTSPSSCRCRSSCRCCRSR